MPKILNYGSLNLDFVYDVEHFVTAGETETSTNLTVNCGGKGLNQSIAAAKAGAKTYHAGKVGNDGSILKELLAENKVDVSHITESDTKSGHAIIQLNTSGQNCILLFPGSNHTVSEEEIDSCLSCFEKGDFLILQNEINNIPYLMKKAYEKGMFIIFNPSPITPEIIDYPIEKVSLLVLNEVEGKALSGKDEPDDILYSLHQKYPDCKILLSLGKSGAVYFDKSDKIEHGIYRVKVVDTTAAGDTLTGYFAACLANGETPQKALELASIASSISVSRAGAAKSIPTLEEVKNCNLEYMK